MPMLDRRIRQLLEVILPFLAIIISTLPPCNDTNLYAVPSHVILILSSLPTPPPNQMLPFMQRLDQQFMGHIFRGADLFHTIQNQRYLFWLNTGELPETLEQIADDVSRTMSRITWRGSARQRRRRNVLSSKNELLLTFIWLRKYLCIDTLALMFDVSLATVSKTVHRVIPVLWHYFKNQVTWPSLNEWIGLRGNWHSFPNAVGCVDGTPHEVYRPLTEPQREFFGGHRHYHLMNTLLIVDNLGNIVFLQAGFLGSMNDAGNFNMMERIGPGTDNDMPVGVVLSADKGYGHIPPLLTPFRQTQIRRMNRVEQHQARRFNRQLSKCRVLVEHTIKHMRTYIKQ